MPAQPPAETTQPDQDVYDIGLPDILPEEASVQAPPQGAVGASGAGGLDAATRPAPPQDPGTGRFISPSKAEHPRYLSNMARDLGFTETDLGEMSTEELGAAVRGAQQWQAEERRRQPQESPRPEPNQTPSEPAIDWGAGADGVPLSEADYAPGVARAIKGHHALEKRVKELEDLVGQLVGLEGRRQNESGYDWVDRTFAGMGELADWLGQGSRKDLDPSGVELERRQLVIDLARKRAGGDKATWESLVAKLPEAAWALSGRKKGAPPAPEPEEPPEVPAAQERRVREWNDGAVARPTHRSGAPEPKGRRAAERAVAEAMKVAAQAGNGRTVEDDGGQYGGL